MPSFDLTDCELATVLDALQRWQAERRRVQMASAGRGVFVHQPGHFDEWEPLDTNGLQRLFEYLRTGSRGPIAGVRE